MKKQEIKGLSAFELLDGLDDDMIQIGRAHV